MYFKSRNAALLVLAITSLVFSRLMFVFFDDPEGPNLLVVGVAAAILYALSLAAYRFTPLPVGSKKLLVTILVQILLVIGFYFLLK